MSTYSMYVHTVACSIHMQTVQINLRLIYVHIQTVETSEELPKITFQNHINRPKERRQPLMPHVRRSARLSGPVIPSLDNPIVCWTQKTRDKKEKRPDAKVETKASHQKSY